MSRYDVSAFNTKQFAVIVGWDNSLQTFFAQVWDLDIEDEDGCVLWAGTYPGSVRSVAALARVISTYAILPEDTAAQLEQDQAASEPPTPLQQWIGLQRGRVDPSCYWPEIEEPYDRRVRVHMLAFGNEGLIRFVDVPVEEIEPRADTLTGDNLLELVYHYGQNEFQPRPQPSVSSGDVAELSDGRLVLCGMEGWKLMRQDEFEAYKEVPKGTRALHGVVTKSEEERG